MKNDTLFYKKKLEKAIIIKSQIMIFDFFDKRKEAMNCNICGNNCNIDRSKYMGKCKTNALKIARYGLHFYEEPIISGKKGSGTIFFCGCPLSCVFCQNEEVSRNLVGKEISVNELATIFRLLEEKNAQNINLVNPTHYVNEIIEALNIYRPKIPIVYNTHGFDSESTIEKLKGYVDIFLPDFKYYDDLIAKRYSKVENYRENCVKCLKKMREMVVDSYFEDGTMKSGMIIRHLILPTHYKDSCDVLKCIKEELPNTLVSVMSQYTPCNDLTNYKEVDRTLFTAEIQKVMKVVDDLMLEGFVQQKQSASCDFIPEWNFTNLYRKVIVCPDSFKGSVSAEEVTEIIANKLKNLETVKEIVKMPIADGGEGTLSVLMNKLGGTIFAEEVFDASNDKKSARYGITKENIAIIELSESSKLSEKSKQNPLKCSTYGFGQLILSALDKKVKKCILTLGGSGTNDGGMGCMTALGVKFFDINGNQLIGNAENLIKIAEIDLSNIDKRLKTCEFTIFCDVANKLLGEEGAANVYGRQKGLNDSEVKFVDEGLKNYSDKISEIFNKDYANVNGSGAAGGTGVSLISFLSGKIRSGIEGVLSLYNFDKEVIDADLIISGEGKLDEQSFMGKVISGVLRHNKNAKVVAICGKCDLSKEFLKEKRVTCYQLIKYGEVEDCIKKPKPYIEKAVDDIIKDYL